MRHQLRILYFTLGFCVSSFIGTYSQNCDTANIKNSTNLGLYGGLPIDYTFADNGRLFAGSITPASVFISDDTAKSWYKAFPNDSLEFECSTRGWGGGCHKILANRKGWVAAVTESEFSGISSAVISFNNGDTGSWQTAIDGYLMGEKGYAQQSVNNIGISDYFFYATMDRYIIKMDGTLRIDSANVIDIIREIPGTDSIYSQVTEIAVANAMDGNQFYFIIDSTGSSVNAPKGKLYKYNGVTFSSISLPSVLTGITKVFVHPRQETSDTVFISGRNSSGQIKIFRSYDGALSWTDITSNPSNALKDVDYSPSWNIPQSNNLILINSIGSLSYDLGSNWVKAISLNKYTYVQPFAVSLFSRDTNIVVAGDKLGSYVSETGCMGEFNPQTNDGFESVLIWDIDRNDSKSVFYLATQSGLAYTTKYKDSTINSIDKWKAPNGEFPVDKEHLNEAVYTVAIDPNDSSHIVVGATAALYISYTAPDSFIWLSFPGYGLPGTITQDLAFVNSTILIAVTGTDVDKFAGNGDIWRSDDGGFNWVNVSPTGFGTGRCISVAYGKTDTVIYVGSGLGLAEAGALWKSNDLGISWTQINTGPDITYASDLNIVDIAVDPRGTDTLYIIAGSDSLSAFVKSIDGGSSYHYLLANSSEESWFNAIEIHPDYPDSIIYMACMRKLYQYNPSLDSIVLIHTGLPSDEIFDIAIGSILVGTTTGFYGIETEEKGTYVYTPAIHSSSKLELQVFPNPVSEHCYIHIEGIPSHSEIKIELIDIIGRPVKNIFVHSYSKGDVIDFDISSVENGIYYIKCRSNNDEVMKPIVISKN